MGENGLAPLEGGPESPSRVKVDWNCLLHILAFSFISVLRIPFSLSVVSKQYRVYIASRCCNPKPRLFKRFDKWPKLFYLFRLRSIGIWAVVLKRKYIGNVFPIGISSSFTLGLQYRIYTVAIWSDLFLGPYFCRMCIVGKGAKIWNRYLQYELTQFKWVHVNHVSTTDGAHVHFKGCNIIRKGNFNINYGKINCIKWIKFVVHSGAFRSIPLLLLYAPHIFM